MTHGWYTNRYERLEVLARECGSGSCPSMGMRMSFYTSPTPKILSFSVVESQFINYLELGS